jgi:regulator of sirC expression with transglutaminase-like and TPR domain
MELAVSLNPRQPPATPGEAETVLAEAGRAADAGFPLFDAAVACAVHDAQGRAPADGYAVLEEATARLRWRLESQPCDEALAGAMSGDLRFAGEVLDYDHIDNADVLSVCERRRGMPVALGLIYLAAARPCGAPLAGVDFPNHFLLRLETEEGPIAIDPFGGGRVIMPSELVRRALHAGLPPHAADRLDDLMRPISDRRVLIRLQNNILVRARAAGDHARAERVSRRWAMLDPSDHRPWLDVAAACEALGRLGGALEALAIAQSLGGAAAGLARDRLRRRLN